VRRARNEQIDRNVYESFHPGSLGNPTEQDLGTRMGHPGGHYGS
jgi:hypothetical protein